MLRTQSQSLLKYFVHIFIFTYPYSIRINNLALIFIAVLAIISSTFIDKKKRLMGNWQLLIYPFYFTSLFLGLSYTTDLYYGGKILERSLPFLILPLSLGTAPKFCEKDRRNIFIVIVVSAAVASIYCVVMNLLFISENDLELRHFFYWEYAHEHLTSFIDFHPTYFAIFVLISVAIILFSFSWISLFQTLCNILLLAYFSFFLILLGSKIGIILLILLITFFGVFKVMRENNKKWIPLFVITNVGILILAYNTPVGYWRFKSFVDSITFMLEGNGINQYDYRSFHWICAWRGIKCEPMTGYGTGDFLHQLNNCYESFNMNDLFDYNAHNQFLDLWLALGICGLLISFLIFLIPLYQSIRIRNPLFMAISFIFLISSLTESIFWSQKGIVLFCFLITIMLGHTNRTVQTQISKSE